MHTRWLAQQSPGATLTVSRLDASSAQTWTTLGWVGIAVGAASAAVGVVLRLTTDSTLTASLTPAPSGAVVHVEVPW